MERGVLGDRVDIIVRIASDRPCPLSTRWWNVNRWLVLLLLISLLVSREGLVGWDGGLGWQNNNSND